ncbi:MAG: succinylglutamate desuccinylase/aspartoacylase family protein [Candidatus Kuenenbacteria bacterium]
MCQKIVKRIHIASLGGFDLDLPIIKIGDGSPKLLIVNNLHGNELSGFYILEEFLKYLPKIQGTLGIISSVNPLGLIHKHRLLPLDFVDLNRNYPPRDKERGINVVIKEKLIELGLNYDVIIDIHNFTRPSLSAGVVIEQMSEDLKKTMNNCFRVLRTDIVIVMSKRIEEEKRAANSFTSYLANQGKLAFGVEYPSTPQLDSKQINKYATGLKDLLNVIGLVNQQGFNLNSYLLPPIFQRQQIISRTTSLFIPSKKLWDKIDAGDILGHVIDIASLQRESLSSPYGGILTEISDRRLCVFGEKVATIGKQLEKF